MILVRTPSRMQALARKWRRRGKSMGFVPTMGALHEGHRSLVRASRRENDLTLASIYVNPLQFGQKEDLKKYPRTLRADLAALRHEEVDAVYLPNDRIMYPKGFATEVRVRGPLVQGLCGPWRPGHFDGVATVVVKLLEAVRPDRLYLGQKDAQQAAVLKRAIRDLDLPVAVRVRPIVREKDGLAMSSRNLRLSPEGRGIAPALYRALRAGREASRRDRRAAVVLREVRKVLGREPRIRLQYLEAVDPGTLLPVRSVRRGTMLALAAHLENVRLIDNIIL